MRSPVKFLLTAAVGLALAAPAFGQQPPQQPTTYPYGGGWYRDADVRKSLNITDEQFKRLNESYEKLGTRYRDDYGRLDKLNERERADRVREMTQTYRNDLYKTYGEIFDEKQMARFRQLDLQYRGVGAYGDPDVVKGLNLTEEQRTKLRELGQQSDTTMRELTEAARTNRDEAMKKYNDYRTRTREQVNSILNEEQRRAWAKLIGDPYDFPAPFGRPDR